MSRTPSLKHTASDLLAYEPFVRSIARSLLSDEDRIGDVVQETWVRALTKGPQKEGSFKSWLGRVVRNLALDQHRRDSSRNAREGAAAREDSVTDDGLDLELHGKIVEAVLALEEPYKTVVIMRYYRGLKLTQVAKKLNRNSATVRSQLRRAHELLRGSLDHEYGGDRSAWLTLCVPLAEKSTTLGGAVFVAPIAAILLIAVTALIAVQQFSGSESTTAQRTNAAATAPIEPATIAAATEDVKTRTVRAESERTPVPSASFAIVTHEGRPVEGVDVWCLEVSKVTPEALQREPELAMDPEKLFSTLGSHSLSDATGRAKLARPDGEFALLAAKGALLVALDPTQTGATTVPVELERVSLVRARVVDPSNRIVVGVPVRLKAAVTDPIRTRNSGPERWDVMSRSSEAESGIASFRGFDALFSPDAQVAWSLSLNVPGLSQQAKSFSVSRDSADPIDLVLSPTSTLVVRNLNAEGTPSSLPGTVSVQGARDTSATLEAHLDDGVASFPFVGAGSNLMVTVNLPSIGASMKREVVAATSPNSTATIDFHRTDAAKVRGRLIDVDGSPLDDTTVYLSIFDEEYKQLQRLQIETNGAGQFVGEVEPEHLGSSAHVTIVKYGRGPRTLCAERREPITLSATTTELGDVQLQEYRRGIEGRCVTEDGTPLVGIQLSANQIPGFQGSGATTDEDGEFRLPGIFSETAFIETRYATDWVLPAPAQVRRDQEEVDLVLVRGGSIEGMVILEEGLDPGLLAVIVYNESQPESAGSSWEAFTNCDSESGKFVVRGLRAGSYRVHFSMNGALLRKLEGVRVTTSSASNDPRVETVDLRESTTAVRFRVLGSDGQPLSSGRALAQALADGKRLGSATSGEGGVMELAFKSNPNATIYVSRHGYRGVFVEPGIDMEDVVLEPGISVDLHTMQRLETSAGKNEYSFSLHRIEDDPNLAGLTRSVGLPGSLMKSGVASVRFPAPGRYRLFYSRQSSAGQEGLMMASVDAPVEGEFVIEVPETDSPLAIEISLPEQLPE